MELCVEVRYYYIVFITINSFKAVFAFTIPYYTIVFAIMDS